MDKKVTLFICLLGLATLASLAVEAQDAPTKTPASQPPQPQPRPDGPDKGDEEFMLGEEDYLDDEEYEDEYEDEEEDEEESKEEMLSDLSEEHYAVKNDCHDLQNMIAQAKKVNETVDPELVQSFEGCKQVLKEIETEMKALTQAIFAESLI